MCKMLRQQQLLQTELLSSFNLLYFGLSAETQITYRRDALVGSEGSVKIAYVQVSPTEMKQMLQYMLNVYIFFKSFVTLRKVKKASRRPVKCWRPLVLDHCLC